MKAKFAMQLRKKTKEIIKAVTEIMISNMKVAEVNIAKNISSLTNSSLAERQRALEEKVKKLKEDVAKEMK